MKRCGGRVGRGFRGPPGLGRGLTPARRSAVWASVLVAALSGAGCGQDEAEGARRAPGLSSAVPGTTAAAGEFVEIGWDALIPEDWRPDELLAQFDVSVLSDDDPRAVELLRQIRALWTEAPVVPDLDGRKVRLPGFVVPLEADAERRTEFLLVPYYGACIHVPPPPPNQIVHVVLAAGEGRRRRLFDAVWVSGTLRVVRSSSELADTGYRLEAQAVEPYRVPSP